MSDKLQIANIVINVGLILAAFWLGQEVKEMKFKINLMWAVFSRRFGTRTESGEGIE